jgi:hypothetical protein
LLTESIHGVTLAFHGIHNHTSLVFQPDEIFRQTRVCQRRAVLQCWTVLCFLQQTAKPTPLSDVRDCNYVGKFGAASETAGNEFFMIKTRRYAVLPYRRQTSDTQYSTASSHLSRRRNCYTMLRRGAARTMWSRGSAPAFRSNVLPPSSG